MLTLQSLEELYASYNFVSDISDTPYVEKLHTLDLEGNEVSELRQLSYIAPTLKSITLAGNRVASDPQYLVTLLEYGKGLETVDDVPVASISKDSCGVGYTTSSPVPKSKERLPTGLSLVQDSELMERFKKLGLSEEMIRESITAADSMLGSEPAEDEILRQSIKSQGFKGEKKGKLRAAAKELAKEKSFDPTARPATASAAEEFGRKKHGLEEVVEEPDEGEPGAGGYSELTDKVFAGNPLQAAKHKKLKGSSNFQKMDIYSLIDQFKDASTNLKEQVSKKLGQTAKIPAVENVVLLPGASAASVMPVIKGPIRARGTFNIKKIRHLKLQ